MTNAKEKLVKRLLEGNDDIFTEFVVVGLEDTLETIITEIERLLGIKNLNDQQWQDLTELCHDGQAAIRVLHYYTAYTYDTQAVLIHKGYDKQKEVF